MKKYLLVLFVLVSGFASSQVPQAFNYQAQVRDGDGNLITNRNVSFKFNIKQGGPTTFPVYIEEHLSSTDDLGQVDLAIGYGAPRLGLFSEIDWMLGSYYLDVELNIGNGYIPMGTTSFLSVPYALFSETSGNSQAPNISEVLNVGNNADDQQIKGLATPTDDRDAANKLYVDQQVLDATQNLAQVLQEDNSANDQQIKELQDPTDPQDAVTKSYVDGLSNNQGLMNFNGWDNYQVWNDNTTVQLTPNSFVFVNANNTTLVFPSEPENCCFGDVIYVYVMGDGASASSAFNLQASGFPVAVGGGDEPLDWISDGIIGGSFNSAGLKTIVNVGDFWMVADFTGAQTTNPNTDDDGDGFSENEGDCNDNDSTIYPGADEICDDGIDQDCDGSDCTTPPPPPPGDECSGSEIQDNFESYTDGQRISTINEGGHWTVWNTGGDTAIQALLSSSAQSRSGNLSGLVPGDGTTDPVLDLGNKIFGQWGLEFWMYIPAGKRAYCNLQGTVPISSGEWIVGNIFFNQDGVNPGLGTIDNSAIGAVNFDFPHDQWFPVVMNFDISTGIAAATWQFNINGIDVIPAGTPFTSADGTTASSLGGIDFYSIDANNELYIDDLCYGEGFIGPNDPEPDVDNDGDGFTENQGDCNDNNATIYPGAEEICDDGIDQDCDGSDCTTEPPPPGANCSGDAFTDDIENYPTGSPVDGDNWLEWVAGIGYGTSSDAHAYSGTQSMLVGGNGVDPVLDLGNKIFGQWGLEFWMYIPSGKEAYMSIQGQTPIGSGEWVIGNWHFNQDTANPGVGNISDSALGLVEFNFPHDLWFPVVMNVDISQGIALATIEINIDGADVLPAGTPFTSADGTTATSLGGINIYSISANNEVYFDDFCYGEGLIGTTDPEPDVDNDGDGYTEAQGDCNDNNATIYPGAEEICDDGIDQDCNGSDCITEPPPPPPGGECSGSGGFTDDMESYPTGSPVAGGPWLEWVPGIGYGTSSDAYAYSGTQSMLVGGDGVDPVLDLGNKIFGQWGLEFWMYIPTGKEAYMNIQGQTPIGSGEWVIGNWHFNQDTANPGVGNISDSALGLVEFIFPHDQWFPVVMNVDISQGIALATIEINIDGADVLPAGTPFTSADGTTATSLGGINIYSISANNEVYFDDFCYGEGLIGTTDPEPDVDNDGDGFTEAQGDCNDNNATIYPGAEEICDDGIDQDCDGSDCTTEPPPPGGIVITVNDFITQEQIGYANVFETEANGGGFAFGESWGIPDLKTVVDGTNNTITIQPNFNAYGDGTDPFWVDQATTNGNKMFEGNTYVEDNSLVGSELTFTGTVTTNTLAGNGQLLFSVNNGPLEGGHQAIPAQFGGPFTTTALTEDAVLVTDESSDPDGNDACEPLTNGPDLAGKVAVLRRGACEFGFKALQAQNEGAVAVIIVNNVEGPPIIMAGGADGGSVTIPVLMVSDVVGEAIIGELANGVNTTMVLSDYTTSAFIEVCNADDLCKQEFVELGPDGTDFSITYDNVEDADAVVRYGFQVFGLNANPVNEIALGSVVLGGDGEPSPDVDNDGDGYTEAQGDCNDNDATIYPGAEEICDDGIDQDCNGSDLSCDDVDNDSDGFTEAQGDCNDNDATIYPGADEICDNGIDNNCDGIIPVIGDLILESAIGTDSQDICSGDSIDEIIYSFSAEYTGVTVVGLPAGVTSTIIGNELIILGTPTDDITTQTLYNYTVTTLGGGDCVDTSISGTLMVKPNPFLLLTSEGGTDSQVLCNGDQLEFIEYYLISGDDINFDTTQVTGLPEGVTFVINGGLFIQGTPSVDINVTTSYTYTISNYWFGECPGNDVTGTITIQPCDDIDNDGDGFTENQGDCNDNDATIYPGAEEICDDGIDQDCNGSDCESEPCDISNPSNNFENAILTSLGFMGANDFITSNNFTLTQINLNLIHDVAATISTVAITYYEDAGGVPGALLGSETLVPASQAVVGSYFGFNVSEVILDISPVNFTEGTYWIGVIAVPSTEEFTGWETTSATSIGADSVISDNGGSSWGSGRDDGVFTLIGICND